VLIVFVRGCTIHKFCLGFALAQSWVFRGRLFFFRAVLGMVREMRKACLSEAGVENRRCRIVSFVSLCLAVLPAWSWVFRGRIFFLRAILCMVREVCEGVWVRPVSQWVAEMGL
jgi:hypothetical protein